MRRHPHKIALRYGETLFTYRDLEARTNRLASYLLLRGAKSGDRIGVALERSPDTVVALLAILQLGAAYIPFDLDFPKQRIEFMLDDSNAAVLLTTRRWSRYFHTRAEEVILEEAWLADGPDEAYERGDADLAYIIYTSGSTGKPKGVMLEHRGLLNLLDSMQRSPGLGENDRVLAMTTIAFDIAAVELFLPLVTGAEIVLVDRNVARDGHALLDVIRRQGVTWVQGTPATWRMMLNTGWNDALPITAISGGEALSRTLADELCVRCHRVYNMYGPTETTVYSTIERIVKGDAVVTIGVPIDHTQVYITDSAMRPLPDGERGEICIGGAGVARGYVRATGEAAAHFIKDPFSDREGARMYRTGDAGRRLPDGRIVYLGREDQQIKIRGYRVELGEIEHYLLRVKGVRDGVVLLKGEAPDEQRLVAYVVTWEPTLSREGIAAWRQTLRRWLPVYMVPAVFVRVEAMPLTGSGKVDRKALASLPLKSGGQAIYEPLGMEMERMVAEVWKEVLDLEEVDPDDDFFELGGHSLIAVEMMAELEKKTGKRLPMASLFEASTVATLSALLQENRNAAPRSLVPIKPHGSKPPLYIVHGVGLTVMVFHSLARNMDDDQPVYGLQAWGFEGNERPLSTVEEIAARYVLEILEHNPEGPYFLAGYSLGGTIAFEMAKQLRARKKEIKLLAMLDSYAGDLQPDAGRWARLAHQLRRQPAKVGFTLASLIRTPSRAFAYQKLSVKMRLRGLLQRLGWSKPTPPAGTSIERLRENLATALLKARDSYRLEVNREDVIELVRVKERLYFLFEPKYLGWKPYALKGVHVTEAKGDHKTFLEPPNDKAVARHLQRLLDENGRQ
jgi:amino acid adenylation domain-containing protein